MSNPQPIGQNLLALDYDLAARLAQWESLRMRMVKAVPETFTRDEWAYLASFVARESLLGAITRSFEGPACGRARSLFRPRGPVAIWLPSNVSLLGPLLLVLVSFAGVPIRLKAGSKADDLCAAFVRYVLDTCGEGELAHFLRDQVSLDRFDRNDPRNAEMAAGASVRIAFGSDASMAAIDALPHPVDSLGIRFGDHRSEAWVELSALDDAALATLIQVFAIYGQAGCTSPRRVVLLGGTPADCAALRERMLALWPTVIRRDVPMHLASQNILQAQLNAAGGWDVRLAPRHGAVLGLGGMERPEMTGLLSLALVAGTVAEACAGLPANIQTIGHCLRDAASLLPAIAQTKVQRFVPLAQMHHFGPVWDGANFLRQIFTEIDLGS